MSPETDSSRTTDDFLIHPDWARLGKPEIAEEIIVEIGPSPEALALEHDKTGRDKICATRAIIVRLVPNSE